MDTRMKIEMVIRASGIAGELLSLVKSPCKLHAKAVVAEAANQLMDLDKFVEALPDER